MPNHKSAAKRERQDEKKNIRNSALRSAVRTAVRKTRDLFDSGSKEEAQKALIEVTRKISSAASKGVVHKKNASRRISRMALHANKAGK